MVLAAAEAARPQPVGGTIVTDVFASLDVKPLPQTAEVETMTTALRSLPSAHARELILEEVAGHPHIQQRELAARLHERTGLAESTLITLFQRLARAGELEPGLDGRRRTYRLPLM